MQPSSIFMIVVFILLCIFVIVGGVTSYFNNTLRLSSFADFISNLLSVPDINSLRYSYIFWYALIMICWWVLTLCFAPRGIITENTTMKVYYSMTIVFILAYMSSFYKTNGQTFEALFARQKIFTLSVFFLTTLVFLFMYNPYNITKNYSLPLYFLLLLSVFVIIATFLSFSQKVENIKGYEFVYDSLKFVGLSVLFAIAMSIIVTMIVRFFHINTLTLPSFFSIFISLFLILSVLALMYRVYDMYTSTNPKKGAMSTTLSPIIQFIVDTLFFIPCFFLECIDFFFKEYKGTPSGVFIVFFIEVVLLCLLVLLYFLYPFISKKYYYEGGEQVLHEPIGLETETILADNISLYSEKEKPHTVKYNFSISSWFYLDTNNNNINKDFIIMNYSYSPFVVYNPSSNLFSVHILNGKKYQDCVGKMDGPKSDEELNVCRVSSSDIVFSTYDFPLQKWNHLVLVYTNGILDVFINNQLMKSITIIIPILEQTTLTTGSINGLHGGICNILFFKESIGAEKIHILYKSVEKNNPPVPTVKFSMF